MTWMLLNEKYTILAELTKLATSTTHIPLPSQSSMTDLCPLKYPPQYSYYMDGSFTLPYHNDNGNIIGMEQVTAPLTQLPISQGTPTSFKLNYILFYQQLNALNPSYQPSYLRKLLTNIYLLHNHICQPTSQHNLLDTLLIITIRAHLQNTQHKVTTQRAYRPFQPTLIFW